MKNIAKKIILSVLSLTAVLGTSAFATDLSGWAVSEYQAASEAGLVSHSVVSKNLQEDITRQEFCELTMNLYKKLAPEELEAYYENERTASPFNDTDSEIAVWARSFGIVEGTPTGEFVPNRDVTREEMTKMLITTMWATGLDGIKVQSNKSDNEILTFSDAASLSGWAKNTMKLALEYGLIKGVTNDELMPLNSVTREQAIATINRTYNKFKDDFAVASYDVVLPTITLPSEGDVIEEGDFDIEWTPISTASNYRVIIKDAQANTVKVNELAGSTSYTVKKGDLPGTKEYTLIIGAILDDNSEVFSMPVDFTYKAKNPYAANSEKAQKVLDTAAQYLGVPYVWGGTKPTGFDCSGFVQYVLRQNGITITRTTYTQWDNDGVYVSRSELEPGDLVYFGSSSAPHHVGMYVGNGTYIHAPSTGDVVKYSSLDSRRDFCGGKRVIF